MKKTTENSSQIAKSAGAIGIAVMFSRVLGLIREQVFASLFGASTANDAFVVAFRIPNLLRDLFGEGALSSAFVTVFTDYDQKKSQNQTWQLASTVLVFFTILLSGITLLAIIFADYIVLLLAPDFSLVEGKVALTSLLTKIMMPFLIVISLSAVVMGILNTKNHFFIPALASSFFNLGSIIGGVSLAFLLPKYSIPAIVGMAIGTLIGGVLQLTIQIPTLLKCKFRLLPKINFRDPGLIRILKLMIPAVIGLSATQINIFINTNFASSCVEGSVSWLQYAFRLVQLPIGLFGVAIGIAVMPLFAKFTSQNDRVALKNSFVSALTMVFCLTIPASVGLFLLAEPIISLIFERGAFSSFDTQQTAQALALYAIGLFAYSSNKIIVPAFYALEKTKYPVIGSFLAILTNILIINLTIDLFQHRAIAFSMSVTMLINFFFLCSVLYHQLGGFSVIKLFIGFGKIGLCSALMGSFIFWANNSFPYSSSNNLLFNIFHILGLIAGGAAIYSVLLYLVRVEEFQQVIGQYKRRLLR